MQTRFPFRYGIASMTELPHLFVRCRCRIAGIESVGITSEGLPPKWFTKDPDTTFEADLAEMLRVIGHASNCAQALPESTSFFNFWWQLFHQQAEWAVTNKIPPLLANLGVSLIERAVLDSLCRALDRPFTHVLRKQQLGIRLNQVYPEFDDTSPVDWLPSAPRTHIKVRHTVGLADPLQTHEIEKEPNDGLPTSLDQCITQYGLSYFKIKISGVLNSDLSRLRSIASVLHSNAPPDFKITLDGNEQFKDIATFAEHWEAYQEDATIRELFTHLLFVEQPLHRDYALSPEVKPALQAWGDAPPLIIDESDATLQTLPQALNLGYRGISHKNCKGIIKSIANACLIERRRRLDANKPYFLSGEDLANVGPVALLQDLTLMASLGIEHIERNGHHYFKGLSAVPREIQQSMLDAHGDLYRAEPTSFPTLQIHNGSLNLRSTIEAPFGVAPLIHLQSFKTIGI